MNLQVLLASTILSANREMDDEVRPARVTSQANMKNLIAGKNLGLRLILARVRQTGGKWGSAVVLKLKPTDLEPVQHVRFTTNAGSRKKQT